jgi:hypothetical protein
MSHPTEARKIYDSAYRKQMARAIVDGILAYKKTLQGRGEERTTEASGKSSTDKLR